MGTQVECFVTGSGPVPYFCYHLVLCSVVSSSLRPHGLSPPGSSVHGHGQRQEYWSGLPFPSPGDLPSPGIKPESPALAGGFFTTSTTFSPCDIRTYKYSHLYKWECREAVSLNLMGSKVHYSNTLLLTTSLCHIATCFCMCDWLVLGSVWMLGVGRVGKLTPFIAFFPSVSKWSYVINFVFDNIV